MFTINQSYISMSDFTSNLLEGMGIAPFVEKYREIWMILSENLLNNELRPFLQAVNAVKIRFTNELDGVFGKVPSIFLFDTGRSFLFNLRRGQVVLCKSKTGLSIGESVSNKLYRNVITEKRCKNI